MRIRWRGLELPSRLVPEAETATATYAKFVCEPFERGFGATISNSLRRILLSILEGSAVTRQAVSKHLQVLAHAGLARGIRRGRETLWRLDAERLAEARRSLDRIAERWDDALARLKNVVEEE